MSEAAETGATGIAGMMTAATRVGSSRWRTRKVVAEVIASLGCGFVPRA